VIFIKDGKVNKVFNVKMIVKVPSGMTEADLARPVVTVSDFETGKLEYEIYSYGEETVVVPVTTGMITPLQRLAADAIKKEMKNYSDRVDVEIISDNKAIVYVPEHDMPSIIGKQGKNIEMIEKKIGISIDLRPISEREGRGEKENIKYEVQIGKNNIIFFLDERYKNKDVDVIVGNDYLLTAKSSKKAIIKIKKDNKIGKIIFNAINAGEEIRLLS
ncbi:MAG: KH domain-containing protein, partial [Candidatus Woesearchaeota archaeon]|nr:KH domain-containing protein [Candidatus Woesearchaeota archaeon]